MKIVPFLKRMLIASAFIFFAVSGLQAQVSDTRIFTSGRLANINGTSGLMSLNDSLFGICTYVADSNPRELKAVLYRKTDLSIKHEFTFPYPSNQVFYAWRFLIEQNKVYLFLSLVNTNQNKEVMHLYKVNNQFKGLQTMFIDTIPNNNLRILNLGLFGDNIYMMRRNFVSLHDTLSITNYDLAGNVVNSKMLNDTVNLSPYTINRGFAIGPFQHPTKANELVYGFKYDCKVACIDKTTLDTTLVMKDPKYYWSHAKYFDGGYQIFADRITASGSIYFTHDIFTNPQFDWQMFFTSRSWSGDSLYEVLIGKRGVAEKGYAYTASQTHNQYIVAGSVPFDNYIIVGQEYRQIAIYRFNEAGFLDTLVLYGNKNHVPVSLLAEPNGDLFMLSTYTNAWTTDTTYFQLDKIPAFLIGLIEDKIVSPEIIMYPNPTTDWVRFKIEEKGLDLIEVYDQQGKLLLRKENPVDNEINISSLPASIYIIVARLSSRERISAIVKKESES